MYIGMFSFNFCITFIGVKTEKNILAFTDDIIEINYMANNLQCHIRRFYESRGNQHSKQSE